MNIAYSLLATLLALSCATVCSAQGGQPSRPAGATPANRVEAARGAYASSACGYEVTFPEAATGYSATSESADGVLTYRIMGTGGPVVSYNVTCVEYPRPIEREAEAGGFLDKMVDNDLARLVALRPVWRGAATMGGRSGRGFVAEVLDTGGLVRYRVVAAGNKLYCVSVLTPKRQIKGLRPDWFGRPASAANGYEELAERFFASFRLAARPAP